MLTALLIGSSGCGLPGSSSATSEPTGTTDAAAYLEQARNLAWSGNLHYGNFAVWADDALLLADPLGYLNRYSLTDERVRSLDWTLENQYARNLAAADDWLFYSAGEMSDTVRKIRADGTNSVRIGQLNLKYLIADHDALYAINVSSGQVIRLQPDGTNRQTLIHHFATALLYDGSCLYVSGTDPDTGLVRLDPNAGTGTVLLRRLVSSLNKQGDWFYFTDPADQFRLYAWSENSLANGQTAVRLCEESLSKPFIVQDNILYFIRTHDQNRLYRISLSGGEPLDLTRAQLVVDDAVASFILLPDLVCYMRPDGRRIYQVPLTGGRASRIA